MKRSVGVVVLVSLGFAIVVAAAGAKTTKTPSTTIPKGAKYVALGSSYAAGSGIPQQLDKCGHSTVNYPRLVAAKLGLTLTDASCGGAVTANILDTPQGDNPPQIDAVTPDTRLVTVTVGGNDVGFVTTAFACGNPEAECTRDPAELDQQFAALDRQFDAIYAAIRAKAPKAKIVISTYPRIVTSTPCEALSFSATEEKLFGALAQRLEDVTVAAAKRNQVLVADPYKTGAGHGPCAAADQAWITGATAIGTNSTIFHPTAAGHVASAALIEKSLAGNPKQGR